MRKTESRRREVWQSAVKLGLDRQSTSTSSTHRMMCLFGKNKLPITAAQSTTLYGIYSNYTTSIRIALIAWVIDMDRIYAKV
uniref:Uncharacterized protein n=1 Tax=Peronospora matthiolae TaxID=2874970 RepID=A0AAV1V1U6_9STRA